MSRSGASTSSACTSRWSKAARCPGAAGERHAQGEAPDLDFIVEQLDWEANVDPHFKENHYLEPVPVGGHTRGRVCRSLDRLWKVDGEQLFTAKELTVDPGA